MKYYYNKATKQKITQAQYNKLSKADQAKCELWRSRNPKSDDPSAATGRGRSAPKGRKDEKVDDQTLESNRNDPTWYTVSQQVLDDVASIPFNAFPGLPEDMHLKWVDYSGPAPDKTDIPNKGNNSTPGVFVLKHLLGYGEAKSGTSALNIASQALYTYVRHVNSGARNYEAPDLMVYITALDAIFAKFAEAQRIYGVAVTYSPENRNFPRLLADALNVDLASIEDNLADYRYELNMIARKLSAFCIPTAFNIYRRHWYISECVFVDAESPRAQMYVYKQPGYYVFNARYPGGGALQYEDDTASGTDDKRTYTDIINDLKTMIDQLFYNEDIGTMSGDILHAFGPGNLFAITEVPEDYSVKFVFDENVLQQIENASTYRGQYFGPNSGLAVLSQKDGFLITPTFSTDSDYDVDCWYINSHKDTVTPSDVMEWTRSACFGGDFGTEITLGFEIYSYKYTEDSFGSHAQTINVYPFSTVVANLNQERLSMLSTFDWHPIVYLVTIDVTSATPSAFYGPVGDLKKYTLVSKKNMQKLHDAAIMGALNSFALIMAKKSAR